MMRLGKQVKSCCRSDAIANNSLLVIDKLKAPTLVQYYILRSSLFIMLSHASSLIHPYALLLSFPVLLTSPRTSLAPSLGLNLGHCDSLIVLHTPLPLLVLRHLAQIYVVSTLGIDFGELDSRTELLRLPRFADDAVEFVDLFETEALGFVDHEPAVGGRGVSVCQADVGG